MQLPTAPHHSLNRHNLSLSSLLAPPLKKSLRMKLTVLFVLSVLTPPTVLVALNLEILAKPYVILQIIFIPLLLVSVGTYLIWEFFKPLNQLYESSLLLAKGEIKHRVNINTGDELEIIARSIDLMAHNLEISFQKLAYDKDIFIAERNKLNTVIYSIVDGIIVLDMNHQILLSNRAAENMTGYSSQEMVGKNFDNLVSMKSSGGELSFQDFQKFAGKDDAVPQKIPHIVDLIGKDSNRIQAEVTIAPIVGGIQANLGSIVIIHDITQEKVFEQMQIDFVSMASHEVRTPLTIIINYLSTLNEEISGKIDKDQKQFLERALYSAQQLAALVSNLLNVSKIERGSFAISLKPLNWVQRLTQLTEDNRGQAVQKNINLKLDPIDPNLPEVLADNVRINEVVNNLIYNAISYTPEGGTITVGCQLQGDHVLSYVRDTGPGIPKEAMPHLFGKFFRVPGALEQASKGSGLGLYISKSIIELHHGKIWAESKPGQGAVFYFTLPLAQGPNDHPTIVQLHNPPQPHA